MGGVILDKILATKRSEIEARKAATPAAELRQRARDACPTRDFASALARDRGDPIRLIAEFKRASPSRGAIRLDLAPEDVAAQYEAAGAAALSVLTDGPFFSGSLDDLRAVRRVVSLPLLRKDFILDGYQLLETRCAGADAVLLIAAALTDDRMRSLHEEAAELTLATVVEVHNEQELERALAIRPKIIGINNRDLTTFAVDIQTSLRLKTMIPAGIVVVSESGIQSRKDVLRLQETGVNAILVGERLMREPSPGDAARALLSANASGRRNDEGRAMNGE